MGTAYGKLLKPAPVKALRVPTFEWGQGLKKWGQWGQISKLKKHKK